MYNDRTTVRTALLGMVVLVLAGCSLRDIMGGSLVDDLKTSKIHADMELTAADGSTWISVLLTTGVNNVSISLASTDQLRAIGAGQARVLSKVAGADINYRTSFAFDTPGTEVTISLLRDGQSDAPTSTVTLPAFADITAPPNGTSYTSSDNIDVTWSVTGGSMSLDIEAECPTSEGTRIATVNSTTDDGAESVGVSTLLDSATGNGAYALTGNCSGTISLTRISNGRVDPAYASGSITATRISSVGVTIVN